MWNRNVVLSACIATAVAAGAVWACGPDFPSQLLDHRDATLKATPQNSFAWEAAHLLPATDTLRPQESEASPYDTPKPVDEAKSQGMTPGQWQRVLTLRQSVDGNKAYDDGKDLPEDLRLYVAGAVDYAAANKACAAAVNPAEATTAAASPTSTAATTACDKPDQAKTDLAIASFEKVLALPPEQATLRSVWAAYTLGRIHALRANAAIDDAAAFKRERDAAAKAFQLTRARAVAGASDTQGLAVSSFGEEARLYLYNGKQQCNWASLYVDNNDCGAGIAAADLKHAIALYAAQAGHGSDSAVQSLATLAGNVLRDDDRAAALVDGPLSQRLLVAYALARLGDDEGSDAATAAPSPAKLNPALPALVQAIEKQGLDHVAGADRLAALAYRSGRYDLAATLAAKAPGPLASWVDAKLALHKGDLVTAAAAYADAAKAFPKSDDPKAAIELSNVPLIGGEQGVLALARGEYVEAMGHLYDAANSVGGDGNIYTDDDSGIGYADDTFYVAERVLTIDELKAFVDAHAAASPAPARSNEKDHQYGTGTLADRLRWLLARRLMRAARYDEAQAYFPVSGDPRFGDVDLRAKANEYAGDMHKADSAWTDIGKAQARYAAAVIARENGMELLGFEQGPDYVDNGGDFQGGSGHSAADLKQTFVTDGERQRFADSAAKLDWRFHYRYIAADEASAAADLLPPRSQAFAAVMCKAASWMREGPPDYEDHYQGYGDTKPSGPSEAQRRVAAYYQHYVKQGAYVSWNDNFGADCEAPDFDRARLLLRHQRIVKAKHLVRHWMPYEIAAFVLVVAGLAGWWMRRRRRNAVA
jgi:hypothetical protein